MAANRETVDPLRLFAGDRLDLFPDFLAGPAGTGSLYTMNRVPVQCTSALNHTPPRPSGTSASHRFGYPLGPREKADQRTPS